jgi:uncharacterized coiled-coil protein SlyX
MPSDPTKAIHGHGECTLFREGTPPVYLTPAGKFAAYWFGRWVIRASVAAVDGAIKKRPKSVTLMTINHPRPLSSIRVGKIEVSEFGSGGYYKDGEGKRRSDGYGDHYVYDAEIVGALAELSAEMEKHAERVRAQFRKIMGKARRVDRRNLADVANGAVPPPLGTLDDDLD